MEERKRIPVGILALFLLISTSSFQLLHASDDDAIFYESFDESFEDRWIVSQKEEYNGHQFILYTLLGDVSIFVVGADEYDELACMYSMNQYFIFDDGK